MLYAQPRQDSVLQGQDIPDGILVGQAQAGDQRAFELLASRYHCPLVSYIRGFLKDSEEVYDVLQYVFFQLYFSLPILLTNVSLKGWLFQVARNRHLDELRRRRRRAEVPCVKPVDFLRTKKRFPSQYDRIIRGESTNVAPPAWGATLDVSLSCNNKGDQYATTD